LIMTGLLLIVCPTTQSLLPVVYPSWLGVICIVIILAREFIVSALRQVAAAKGTVLAADKGGKIKATVQYIAVTLYMVFAFVQKDIFPKVDYVSNVPQWVAIVRFVLMLILLAATFLTIYSGASYLIRNRHVFKDAVKPETKDQEKEQVKVKKISIDQVSKTDKIHCEQIDKLFYDAVIFVIDNNRPSATALQREFIIGYPRASRIMDYMEASGIVSAVGEDNKRAVLITKEEFEKRI